MEAKTININKKQSSTPEGSKENKDFDIDETMKVLDQSTTLLPKVFNFVNLMGDKFEHEQTKRKLSELTDAYKNIHEAIEKLPGMDLSIEEQEKVLIEEEENLKKKRIKVEKYKNLPIFKTSLITLSPEVVSNESTSITLRDDTNEEANQVDNSKMNEQVENDLNHVNGTNGK